MLRMVRERNVLGFTNLEKVSMNIFGCKYYLIILRAIGGSFDIVLKNENLSI